MGERESAVPSGPVSVWTFLGSAGDGNDDFELLESVPMREGLVGTDSSCELQLRDPMLTPKHARVLQREGDWYVGGIAAASPTRINGVATLPGQAVRLSIGDVVELGSARFRFGGEPPSRIGINAHDETAVLLAGDRLAELGSPLGMRLLETEAPQSSWLPGSEQAISQGLVVPEWTRGLLTALSVRQCDLAIVRSILAEEAAVSLERLVVLVATCGPDSEEEWTRGLLQALAVTRPPRLRRLDLGWLHRALAETRVGRDWQAVARRIPLETTLSQAYRIAGNPRITMLRTSPGWPPVGATTPLANPGQVLFGEEQAGDDQIALVRPRSGIRGETGALFSSKSGTSFLCAELAARDFRLNGFPRDAGETRLAHGDLVGTERFAFRFEEAS